MVCDKQMRECHHITLEKMVKHEQILPLNFQTLGASCRHFGICILAVDCLAEARFGHPAPEFEPSG